jgi:hypothetical protein
MENRERLADAGCYETVVFENPDYDDAIIGVTQDGKAVYDYAKMVENLMREDNISQEDAIDFIEYNTIRALPYAGEDAPVIIHLLEDLGV